MIQKHFRFVNANDNSCYLYLVVLGVAVDKYGDSDVSPMNVYSRKLMLLIEVIIIVARFL
mgnify:CR=1 FL=1